MGTERYLINNYTLKFRLYPNKAQAEMIDKILHGVRVFYNGVLHDMWVNKVNVNEAQNENGETIHFPNVNLAVKASYLKEMEERYPQISVVPRSALSSNGGCILTDMKKSFSSQVSEGKRKGNSCRPIEYSKPRYYSNKYPRTSYTYQECMSKFTFSDNQNVAYINLAKVGKVKMRGLKGYNKNLKFGEPATMSLQEYALENKKKAHKVTVSKSNLGWYELAILIPVVSKEMRNVSDDREEVGIDIGVKDIVICSNGDKYVNHHFRNGENGEVKRHRDKLQKKVARQWGWSNVKFRNEYKKDNTITPSKGYLATQMKIAKLEKSIQRKREYYNHNITADLIKKYDFIGIETLSIKDMIESRKKEWGTINKRGKRVTHKDVSRTIEAFQDASMGNVIEKLKYKAEWYRITLQPISKWFPSSKTCHVCGYVFKELSLDMRVWCCPECNTAHDRDVNASINIKRMSKIAYTDKVKKSKVA